MSDESVNPVVAAFEAFNEAWGAFQLAMRCGAHASSPQEVTEAQTLIWNASEAVDATSAALAAQLAKSNEGLRKSIARTRMMAKFVPPAETEAN